MIASLLICELHVRPLMAGGETGSSVQKRPVFCSLSAKEGLTRVLLVLVFSARMGSVVGLLQCRPPVCSCELEDAGRTHTVNTRGAGGQGAHAVPPLLTRST